MQSTRNRSVFRVILPALGLLSLLIAIGQDVGGVRTAAFSFADDARPDAANGRIIYQRGPNSTSELWAITAGSGTAFGLRRGYHPAVSPDGTKVAFVDNTPGPTNGFLMLMNADGTNVRQLATPRQGFTPTWSPNGTRLAYVKGDFDSVGDNGKGRLYIVEMLPGSEGANESELPLSAEFISKPAWGSTNRIAFGVLQTRTGGGFEGLGVGVTQSIPTFPSSYTFNYTLIATGHASDREPTWESDGLFLAYISTRDYPMGNASEIYTSAANGASPRRLTNSVSFKSQPSLSPDGTTVVFSQGGTQGPNNANLRSVSSACSNCTTSAMITGFSSGDRFPNWGALPSASPTPTPAVSNGKVVFERFNSTAGVTQVYTINDTSGATASVLCGGTTESRRPAFSQDGSKLAFVRANIIWTADANCSNASQFSTGIPGTDPSWSPDGTKIVFARGTTFTDIWTMNADGTGTTKITDIATETKPSGSFSNQTPSWGANNKIVFRGTFRKIVNGSLASVGDIWTVDPAGTTFARLTDDPVHAYAPDWSPDASKIVFASDRATNKGEIYTMDAAGTNQTRITNNATISNSNPAWSPDGTKIVHDDDFSRITRRSADGTAGSNLAQPGGFPDWAPGLAGADVRISSIVKTPGSGASGAIDQMLNFRVNLFNNGPAAATGVTVTTDPLPTWVFFQPGPSSAGCTMNADRTVTCSFAAGLAGSGSGAAGFVDIAMTASQVGTINFRARVSATQPDPDLTNNEATATLVISNLADLTVELADLTTQNPQADVEFSYRVRLRNLGPNASAANTQLTIEVPMNTFIQRPPGVAARDAITGCLQVGTGRNYRCNIGTIPNGTERNFLLKVKPATNGPITLRADLNPDEADPTPANRSVQLQLNVADVPRPANDHLANAQTVSGEDFSVTGSNVNATLERTNNTIASTGELMHARVAGSKSVWYLWAAPARPGTVSVTTAGSSFDTILDVYEFNGAVPLPVIGYDDDGGPLSTSVVSFRYNPGAAYYIAVDGYQGQSGSVKLNFNVTPFEDPGDYVIIQKITDFYPAAGCSVVSNIGDPLCAAMERAPDGTSMRLSNGVLKMRIQGENFTPQSKVLIDGQPPIGFDLANNPVPANTTPISSTEVEVLVPPRPAMLRQRILGAGVTTPVTINTGGSDRPAQNYLAIAANEARFKAVDLQNATIQPGQEVEICGNRILNKDGGRVCIKFFNDRPTPITVTPSWFAASAECTNARDEVKCATKQYDTAFGVNSRSGGRVTVTHQFVLPPGLASLPQNLKLTFTGGKPLVGPNGSPLVGQDGSTLVGQDGSTLVGQDGSTLVGQDGSTLVGQDGSTLVGQDGSTLVGQDGSTLLIKAAQLVGQDGGTRPHDPFGLNWLTVAGRTDGSEALSQPGRPVAPGDLSNGSTGYAVATGSGGSEPAVTYQYDEATGETLATVSVIFDNTSVPRVSNLNNLAFALDLNPAVIKLPSTAITVDEGAGVATISIERSGDTTAPASVDYATDHGLAAGTCSPAAGTAGLASDRCDFAKTLGTLRFAAGETSKQVNIPIIDDSYAEGGEPFKLIVGNAVGAAVEMPSAATITITDNDAANAPTNPLDGADGRFCVRQQHLDLSGREPSAAELASVADPIAQCGSDATCRRTKGFDAAEAVFTSSEPAWNYVFRLYRAAFGNEQPFPIPDASNTVEAKKWPAYAALAADRAMLTNGSTFAADKQGVANSFVLRPAFVNKFSVTTLTTGPAFVDAVIAAIRTGNGVDLVAQRASLIDEYDAAGGSLAGRGRVMYRIADVSVTNTVDNSLFVGAESSRAFVSLLNAGYLKRDPNVASLTDLLAQLQFGATRRALIEQFVGGASYRSRFAATASDATVSGRVLTPSGQSLRNVVVSLITPAGQRRTATTSSFGLFSFGNVPTGSSYTVTVASKRYRFAPRNIEQLGGSLNLGDLVGLE